MGFGISMGQGLLVKGHGVLVDALFDAELGGIYSDMF
jgi:hypothetical protein